jgi:hypothetical protein
MVWECPQCSEPLPQDAEELATAKFCRNCGTPYFSNGKTQRSTKAGN